jgi:hypothetical protein
VRIQHTPAVAVFMPVPIPATTLPTIIYKSFSTYTNIPTT